MRLWSLHPSQLDARGLVACWREGLLARKVLLGQTRGYRNHPQLERFKAFDDPIPVVDSYLKGLCLEATSRGYTFDTTKIGPRFSRQKLDVSDGQLSYEWAHLLAKLKQRDPAKYQALASQQEPRPHPIFRVVAGAVEPWERP